MLTDCQPESLLQAAKEIVSVSIKHLKDKGFNRKDHKRSERSNEAEFIPSKEHTPHSQCYFY